MRGRDGTADSERGGASLPRDSASCSVQETFHCTPLGNLIPDSSAEEYPRDRSAPTK